MTDNSNKLWLPDDQPDEDEIALYAEAEAAGVANLRSREAPADATAALEALAKAVIGAVRSVDLDHNVGEFFQSIKVVSYGTGRFNLVVESAHLDVDQNRLRAVLQDAMADESYGKELRRIEIGDNNEPTSPTSGPNGDGPGDQCGPAGETP